MCMLENCIVTVGDLKTVISMCSNLCLSDHLCGFDPGK